MPTGQIDLLDSLIYTGIVLLLLSQITEKVTTFIRTYINVLVNRRRKIHRRKTFFGKVVKRLIAALAALDDVSDLAKSRIQEVPDPDKAKVEFAITKLSVLIGFILALAFKANLFELVGSEAPPHTLLGWTNPHLCFQGTCWWYVLKVFPGCFATGFLLTFGSKFFHDLLETLYEVKRLRRKLADEYTFRSPDLSTLEQRIAATGDDPVKIVLERHKIRLMLTFPNIVSIERVFDNRGNSELEIRVSDENLDELQTYVFDYLEGGEVKQLRHVRFVPNATRVTGLAGAKLFVGDWIFNNATDENRGTLGFFATRLADKANVLVTCYHVLRTDQHGWTELGNASDSFNRVFGAMQTSNGATEFSEIGILIDGVINDWLDCALVRLHPGFVFKNEDSELGAFRIREDDMAGPGTAVRINGAKSEPGDGAVRSIENAVKIDYGDQMRVLNDLVCIENPKQPSSSLTGPGDSGAVVIDLALNAVAMVIAGDDKYTYAIPIRRLMKAFDLQ